MRTIFIALVSSGLFFALTSCDPSSRLVGCWENNDLWRKNWEFESSGTFIYHNYDSEYWKENGWVGKWKLVKYVPPFTDPDSLGEFLDNLPEEARKYMNRDRMPEYEIVNYDMVNAFYPSLAGKPTLIEENRFVLLDLTEEEMVLLYLPLYQEVATWKRAE